MSYPDISVVIPVKNDVRGLKSCIEGILAQNIPVLEIIVIDSGSTDGSVQLARTYEKVRVFEIDPDSFNHGATRNLGTSLAKGEYVVFTVQDAYPSDNEWLNNLLAGFINDKVAGVCGQQIVPHDTDKNPVQWFRPQSDPRMRIVQLSRIELQNLSPEELNMVCSWDDVTAMYKRDIKLRIPFRHISFGEDMIWAYDALREGYAIVYNTAARVNHYHQENPDYTFRRVLTTLYFRYRNFRFIPDVKPVNLKWILGIMRLIYFTPALSLKKKWYWLRYNIVQKQSVNRAFENFMSAMAKGEDELESLHVKYCGKPPMAENSRVTL